MTHINAEYIDDVPEDIRKYAVGAIRDILLEDDQTGKIVHVVLNEFLLAPYLDGDHDPFENARDNWVDTIAIQAYTKAGLLPPNKTISINSSAQELQGTELQRNSNSTAGGGGNTTMPTLATEDTETPNNQQPDGTLPSKTAAAPDNATSVSDAITVLDVSQVASLASPPPTEDAHETPSTVEQADQYSTTAETLPLPPSSMLSHTESPPRPRIRRRPLHRRPPTRLPTEEEKAMAQAYARTKR